MKRVLISIQKPHTDNIRAFLKKIEVRKNKPTIPIPFPVLIYETKAKGGCGKVIGEFVCNKIDKFKFNWAEFTAYGNKTYMITETQLKNTCLSRADFNAYGCTENGHKERLYGWHISNLVIYDEPKELSEFKKQNFCYKAGDIDNLGCWEGGCVEQELGWCDGRCSVVESPPQSWCYVEVEL